MKRIDKYEARTLIFIGFAIASLLFLGFFFKEITGCIIVDQGIYDC